MKFNFLNLNNFFANLAKFAKFTKIGLAFSLFFLLVSCGPPKYEQLKLLKNYQDEVTFARAEFGKDGAPSLEDLEGEFFFNMFVFMPAGKNFTYNNKTYQHRVIIKKNADGKTLRLETSPIKFGTMPLMPKFSFDKVSLVKLSTGQFSFVNDEPGYGKFYTQPGEGMKEGFTLLKYNSIDLMPAGSEVVMLDLGAGKKRPMMKIAIDFDQKLETDENGYYTVQELYTNKTPGYENASKETLKKINDYVKNMIAGVGSMATGMKGATATHCDYRIEFQGYRLKYAGHKARPYLFNKGQTNYKYLPKTKVCYMPTRLSGKFYDFDKPVEGAKVEVLDAKTSDVLNLGGPEIITDKEGNFEISSVSQPNFKGGFYKLKFTYTKNGTGKTSFYPDRAEIENAEVVKLQPNTTRRGLFADVPGFRIIITPKAGGRYLNDLVKIKLYKNGKEEDDIIGEFFTEKYAYPFMGWKMSTLYKNMLILDDEKLKNLNIDPNAKYYIGVEILKPTEWDGAPDGRQFWYRGPYLTDVNHWSKDLAEPVNLSLKNHKQSIFIPMLSRPYFTNVEVRQEHISQDSNKLLKTVISDIDYGNSAVKVNYKLTAKSGENISYNKISKTRTDFAIYKIAHMILDENNNRYRADKYSYIVGKKYKFYSQVVAHCPYITFYKNNNELYHTSNKEGTALFWGYYYGGYYEDELENPYPCEPVNGKEYWLKSYVPYSSGHGDEAKELPLAKLVDSAEQAEWSVFNYINDYFNLHALLLRNPQKFVPFGVSAPAVDDYSVYGDMLDSNNTP